MSDHIVAFDVETTGLNPKLDRILQLSMVKFETSTFRTIAEKSWYIKPEGDYYITEAASDVNGLTQEFIEQNGVSLASIIDEIDAFWEGCDLLTYNGNSFDIKFIYYEWQRQHRAFNIGDRLCYDSKLIETRLHSNHLVDVYRRYTGQTMEEAGLQAHDALSDVKATIEVFRNQSVIREDLAELPETRVLTIDDSVVNKPTPNRPVNLVFKNGKYRDTELWVVACKDPSYIKWWSQNVAIKASRDLVRSYLKKRQEEER